ncbi:hypothetical protein [Alkalicoccobacillus porphyridii]|uniref:Lipoprotein n=1 Tax=Alkalicoccobacillus porphyridii TaxID=2597270 RepID=A0A554A158_9BACI|nr:hypothetical protein [Alkalicoccobacillus porphyridii]TSB47432.1 hypothetical protein FN960_06770 [Alkalicoccobacillus porphyridii]
MKWRTAAIGMLCAGLLLGCSEAETIQEPESEPDVQEEILEENEDGRAVEDEYTQQFLVSNEEEEEGFYRMRGELDGFDMLIPRDAVMDEDAHTVIDDSEEAFVYSVGEQEELIVELTYDRGVTEELRDGHVGEFTDSLNYNGVVNHEMEQGMRYFTGALEEEENQIYWAYIFPEEEEDSQAFTIIYTTSSSAERETFDKLIQSFQLSEYLQ